MLSKGSYCLCIKVHDTTETRIGALGNIVFDAGNYIYVGSALNSIIPRLRRHIKTSNGQNKTFHWHIDYLLKEPNVQIEHIFTENSNKRMECKLSSIISGHGEAILGFGCSDCKCKSHLYIVKEFNFLKKMGLKDISLEVLTINSKTYY